MKCVCVSVYVSGFRKTKSKATSGRNKLIRKNYYFYRALQIFSSNAGEWVSGLEDWRRGRVHIDNDIDIDPRWLYCGFSCLARVDRFDSAILRANWCLNERGTYRVNCLVEDAPRFLVFAKSGAYLHVALEMNLLVCGRQSRWTLERVGR